MLLKTKFDIDESIYIIQGHPDYGRKAVVTGPFIIGRVEKQVTDSPGMYDEENPPEIAFENYKAKKGEEERYMCVETGVGSGSVWYPESMFRTSEEAQTECDKINEGHSQPES